MEFPTLQLLHILDMIRGKHAWDNDCFDAAMDIIKYAYHQFFGKNELKAELEDFDAEKAIVGLLDEEAKGVGPGVWVALAVWLLKKILEKAV